MVKLFLSISIFSVITFPQLAHLKAEEILKYEKLTLDQCISIALENNLDFKNSKERLLMKESSYRAAKAALALTGALTESSGWSEETRSDILELNISKPFLSGGSFIISTDTEKDDLGEEETYTTQIRIGYTQPLLRGLGGTSLETTRRGRKIIDEQIEIDRNLRKTRLSLGFRVTSNFYAVLRAQRGIEIAEASLKEAELFLKAAKTKKEEGEVAKIDVARAEVQVTQKKAELIAAQGNDQLAQDSFVQLLGLKEGTIITLNRKIEYTPIEVDTDTFIKAAFENRLDYKRAKLDLEASRISSKLARKNLFPQLDIGVYHESEGSGDTFDESLEFEEPEWTTRLSLSLPMHEVSRRERYAQALSQERIRENDLENIKQVIVLDLRRAITNLKQREESLKVLFENIKQAKEGLRLARLSYEEGLISNLDVLRAQDDYTRAQNSYIEVLTQHEVAVAQFKRVMGVEWWDLREEGE
jgi:outer membrane protein TolC